MIRAEIKEAVKEALREEIEPLYVDREVHYQHHQFIQDLIDWMEDCKGTFRSTVVRALVWGLLSLLVFGFIFFGREHFR